jgi:hypothetical protein
LPSPLPLPLPLSSSPSSSSSPLLPRPGSRGTTEYAGGARGPTAATAAAAAGASAARGAGAIFPRGSAATKPVALARLSRRDVLVRIVKEEKKEFASGVFGFVECPSKSKWL